MARIQYRGLYAYITLWTAASEILPQKGDAGQMSEIGSSWPAVLPMKTAVPGNLGHLFAQAVVVCSVLAPCTNACFRPGAYMLGLADIRKLRGEFPAWNLREPSRSAEVNNALYCMLAGMPCRGTCCFVSSRSALDA